MASLDEFDQAVLIAFKQTSQQHAPDIQHNAEQYCEMMKLSPDGWRAALPKLHEATTSKKSDYIKFWSLEVIFYAISTYYNDLSEDDRGFIRTQMMIYVRDVLPQFTIPAFLKGKLSSIFVGIIKYDFPSRWSTFFTDFSSILPPLTPTMSTEPIELYLRVLQSLDDDVILSNAAYASLRSQDRQLMTISMNIKDALREGAIAYIVDQLHAICMNFIETKPDISSQALRVLSVYSDWIELELLVNAKFFPFLFQCISHDSLRSSAILLLTGICDKGMPVDKRIALYQHLEVIPFIMGYNFSTVEQRDEDEFYNDQLDFSRLVARFLSVIIVRLCSDYEGLLHGYIKPLSEKSKNKPNSLKNAIFGSKQQTPSREPISYASFLSSQPSDIQNQIYLLGTYLMAIFPAIMLCFDNRDFEVSSQVIDALMMILSLMKFPALFDDEFLTCHAQQANTDTTPFIHTSSYRKHLIYNPFSPGIPLTSHTIPHNDFKATLAPTLPCIGKVGDRIDFTTKIFPITDGMIEDASYFHQLIPLYFNNDVIQQTENNFEQIVSTFQRVHPIKPSPLFLNKKTEILTMLFHMAMLKYRYPSWYCFDAPDTREQGYDTYRGQVLDRIIRALCTIDAHYVLFLTHRYTFHLLLALQTSITSAAKSGGSTSQPASINHITNCLHQPYAYISANCDTTLPVHPVNQPQALPLPPTPFPVTFPQRLLAMFPIQTNASHIYTPFALVDPNQGFSLVSSPPGDVPLQIQSAYDTTYSSTLAVPHDLSLHVLRFIRPFEALYRFLYVLSDVSVPVNTMLSSSLFSHLMGMALCNPMLLFISQQLGGLAQTQLALPDNKSMTASDIREYCVPELIRSPSFATFIQKFSPILVQYPQHCNDILQLLITPLHHFASSFQRVIHYILQQTSNITSTTQSSSSISIYQQINFPHIIGSILTVIRTILNRPISSTDIHMLSSNVYVSSSTSSTGVDTALLHSLSSQPQQHNVVDICLIFCEVLSKVMSRRSIFQHYHANALTISNGDATTATNGSAIPPIYKVLHIPYQALESLFKEHQTVTRQYGADTYCIRAAECITALSSMIKELSSGDFLTTLTGDERLLTSQLFQEVITLTMNVLIGSNYNDRITLKAITLLHTLVEVSKDVILPMLPSILEALVSSWGKNTMFAVIQLINQLAIRFKSQVAFLFNTLLPIIVQSFHQLLQLYDGLDEKIKNSGSGANSKAGSGSAAAATSSAGSSGVGATSSSASAGHTPGNNPQEVGLELSAALSQEKQERDGLCKLFLTFIRDLCMHELFSTFEQEANKQLLPQVLTCCHHMLTFDISDANIYKFAIQSVKLLVQMLYHIDMNTNSIIPQPQQQQQQQQQSPSSSPVVTTIPLGLNMITIDPSNESLVSSLFDNNAIYSFISTQLIPSILFTPLKTTISIRDPAFISLVREVVSFLRVIAVVSKQGFLMIVHQLLMQQQQQQLDVSDPAAAAAVTVTANQRNTPIFTSRELYEQNVARLLNLLVSNSPSEFEAMCASLRDVFMYLKLPPST